MTTSPSKITITYQLEQATELAQFRHPKTGLRKLHLHYWYKPEQGAILADWVTETTDVKWLKQQIEKGTIYIKTPS